MNLSVDVDFFSAIDQEDKPIQISKILESIKTAHNDLVTWPVDRIVEIFDDFSKHLLDPQNKIHKSYPNSGIPFIANWCRKTNLESILDLSFGERAFLDGFLPGRANPSRVYRAFPRGIAVHWMAGNVPTLGFLSLIIGVLTKNANLIKVSSSSNKILSELLSILSQVQSDVSQNGKDLAKSIAVVRYDRSRLDMAETLSKSADIRVIWGNDESVNTIRKLSAKTEAVDIVFPNKTSLMVIGSKVLENTDLQSLAKRIATDISVFEQKACASPHTIFVETETDRILETFAENLKRQLINTLRSMPKTVPTEKEVSMLLKMRAQYDMFYRAWYSEGTEFTILCDELFQLGPAIGNRTIYLRKIDNLEKVADLITPKVQSVGIIADDQQTEKLASLYGQRGVQRFAKLGAMTHFEIPWDGHFFPQYMVRWTSRPIFAR
jgi:hypothetical protein